MSEEMRWLAGQWAGALESAVGMMTGLEAKVKVDSASLPDAAQHWEVSVSGDPAARIVVGAPGEAVLRLGESLLAAAGLTGAGPEDLKGAFVEVLQQSLSPLSQAIGARAGREIQFTPALETSSPPPDGLSCAVALSLDGADLPSFRFCCTAELLGLFTRRDPAPGAPPKPPSGEMRAGGADAAGGQGSRTFELLLEVEMPVSVSFGRAQIRLKDAIKLTTGSIVELNRSISEPVELVVNNCVVARGEVVVVEGNYGVRISEIISREERLRTLF